MKRRQTVRISDLVLEVNERNAKSTCPPDVRHGWNAMLESILYATDNYAGFGYYSADSVPAGFKPGILRDAENRPSFPDETRRFYYLYL
jgi:hypothetical protein